MSLKAGGQRCRCGACGQYFNSVSVFDRHRVGAYSSSRRCLTATQMTERDWLRNASGFWTTGAMPASTFHRARRSGDRLDPAPSP